MADDSPELLGRHVSFSDGVQKLCLSMVNVPHDRDNRRSVPAVFGILILLLPDNGFIKEGHDLHVRPVIELAGVQGRAPGAGDDQGWFGPLRVHSPGGAEQE